ncbi:alpha/beta fold hydrolase [Streptomyces rapamycinicus]|uniref:Lysophospholipase n=2 Tax=Streptomyces rapamycinicus TaxID=1226757 RepID=A0A0A0NHS6_STRRN|nr:alpha/beta hydrolase [Streptomyces rapamycinicus]AGP59122.1 lysophospholipase [Streptomyces rapamycinicus NRRL 5491]MBB4786849.1 alpha-beta hydrolase superfamily lysophospholipase [Streptomyces rapamycinicus]RLV77693.1 lysophospholipase [Streptomyces rapamycinicus NRRL 5491]UTO66887.1 alpha/beta hydrolase [Streptomyces rapamycinicus]UTP34842.1 alpha/beta hydrolase [Streptomyces rapamycinicus NRRL 5491]
MPDGGITHRTDQLPMPDGARVVTYSWLPENGAVRAIVQIAHGAAEHARRYDRFARFLAAHGYAVVASDHRGHGATAESTGGFGVVGEEGDGWRAIVSDLRAIGERARAAHPRAPLVLLGHSMGSMLARDCAQEYGEELTGLILSGTFRSLPGTETEEALTGIAQEIAERGRNARSTFTPTLFASFNDPYEHIQDRTGFEWLSRDAAEVATYAGDERCGFAFSAGLSQDWVRGVRKINDPRHQARTPAALPVHVAVGTEDPCNQGMTLVYELLEDFRYGGTRELTWKGYQGARHEILNETNRDEVQQDLLTWLEKHT